MNDLEFAALLVSRVCHDLVSPVGAVVNGLEVLEDETDAEMREDALRLVASSAEQATARLQFARVAYGAAGSAGAELDLTEVARVVGALLKGGKVELAWTAQAINWPKNWAKLLMNTIVLAAECLPRGGRVSVETSLDPQKRSFKVTATGTVVRINQDSERALKGEQAGALDGRMIQPFLTHLLACSVNVDVTVNVTEAAVEFAAGTP